MNNLVSETHEEFVVRRLREIDDTLDHTRMIQLEINGKLDYIIKALQKINK